MKNYASDAAKYYDLIHSKKDYESEASFLSSVFLNETSGLQTKILDVGCGTGNHSVLLAQQNPDKTFFGIDISGDMIDIAKSKSKDISNLSFHNIDLSKFGQDKFNAAICMFYVINHILSLEGLISFFSAVKDKLAPDSVFVFDCWNGIAAIQDPPVANTRTRYQDSKMVLRTECYPEIDFFDSSVVMKNKIEIRGSSGEYYSYREELQHVIWSPKAIKDSLIMSGFSQVDSFKPYGFKKCTTDDFKMVFVCK
tara:strand:+ start:102 stop:860 length:759 start_codon:yes stop_codon:yes gene_type:complete